MPAPSVCDLANERAVEDADVGPLDGYDVVARLGDLVDHLVQVVSGVGDVGLADCVWPRPSDPHGQGPVPGPLRLHLQ